MCAQYERDPSPITRHDARLSAQDAAPPPPLPALPQHWGHKEQAELYRIQTEDAWGRWLWLVAELVPTGFCLLGLPLIAWRLITIKLAAVRP